MFDLVLLSATRGSSTIVMVAWILVFFGLMYFLILKPQNKEKKRMQDMMANMEVGDFIVTTSGFYGEIISITDEDVVVEFGNNKNCRIPMKKAAIAEIEKAGSAVVAPEPKDNKGNKNSKNDKNSKDIKDNTETVSSEETKKEESGE